MKQLDISSVVCRRSVVAALIGFVLLGGGCASNSPSTYPKMDNQAMLSLLARRAHLIHTVTAEVSLELTRPDGQSVHLDGAIAMQPPDHARIRAWKFGQPVFDLTVTPAGSYIIAPNDPSHGTQIRAAGAGAGELARTWALLFGGFFDLPGLKIVQQSGQTIVRRPSSGSGPEIDCEIDTATLTPRRYRLVDPSGSTRFLLTLDHYVRYGPAGPPESEIVFPGHLVAVSEETGMIVVDLRNVEINVDLSPSALIPPKRAEKLP